MSKISFLFSNKGSNLVVETTAKFEEEQMVYEDYNKIVRNIFEFENFRNGSEVIDLPDAFDGDDLEVI